MRYIELWPKGFIILDAVVSTVCLGFHVVSMVEKTLRKKCTYGNNCSYPDDCQACHFKWEPKQELLRGWAPIGLSLVQIMLVVLLRSGIKNKIALHLQRWVLLTIVTALFIYAASVVTFLKEDLFFAPLIGGGILLLFKPVQVVVVLIYIKTLAGGYYRGLCSLTVLRSLKTINSKRAGNFVPPQPNPPPLVSTRHAEISDILPYPPPIIDEGALSSEVKNGAETLPIFYIQSEINEPNLKILDGVTHLSYHHRPKSKQNHFGQGTHDDAFRGRVESPDLRHSSNKKADELKDILGQIRREKQNREETRLELVSERQRQRSDDVRDQTSFKSGTGLDDDVDDNKKQEDVHSEIENDKHEMKDVTQLKHVSTTEKVEANLHGKLLHLYETIQQSRFEVEQKERALLAHVQESLWKLLRDGQRNSKSN